MASWTWRLSLALIVSAAGGCFSDPGGGSAAESASDSASDGASDSNTTGSSDAASTDPGAGTSSSASASDSDNASTSAATGPGGCELAPACSPGQLEFGDDCGDCAIEQRVCGDDCAWGEWSCVADAESCGVWILPEGAREWTALPIELNGVAQYTPDDPIQAAFDLDMSDSAYVLTEQEFHVLDLETLTWLNRGDRKDMFDEASEQNLEGALSINIGKKANQGISNKEAVILYSDEDYWAFELSAGEASANFFEEGPCCGQLEEWMGPHAPDPGDMRGIWLDLSGNPSWNPIDIANCPPVNDGTPVTRYAGFIVVDQTVRVQDYTACDAFVGTFSYEQYAPFALPKAPPDPEVIGAALFHDGDLYVFKADV